MPNFDTKAQQKIDFHYQFGLIDIQRNFENLEKLEIQRSNQFQQIYQQQYPEPKIKKIVKKIKKYFALKLPECRKLKSHMLVKKIFQYLTIKKNTQTSQQHLSLESSVNLAQNDTPQFQQQLSASELSKTIFNEDTEITVKPELNNFFNQLGQYYKHQFWLLKNKLYKKQRNIPNWQKNLYSKLFPKQRTSILLQKIKQIFKKTPTRKDFTFLKVNLILADFWKEKISLQRFQNFISKKSNMKQEYKVSYLNASKQFFQSFQMNQNPAVYSYSKKQSKRIKVGLFKQIAYFIMLQNKSLLTKQNGLFITKDFQRKMTRKSQIMLNQSVLKIKKIKKENKNKQKLTQKRKGKAVRLDNNIKKDLIVFYMKLFSQGEWKKKVQSINLYINAKINYKKYGSQQQKNIQKQKYQEMETQFSSLVFLFTLLLDQHLDLLQVEKNTLIEQFEQRNERPFNETSMQDENLQFNPLQEQNHIDDASQMFKSEVYNYNLNPNLYTIHFQRIQGLSVNESQQSQRTIIKLFKGKVRRSCRKRNTQRDPQSFDFFGSSYEYDSSNIQNNYSSEYSELHLQSSVSSRYSNRSKRKMIKKGY